MACLQTKHIFFPPVDSPRAGISPGILFRILAPVLLLALLVPAAFSQDVVKDSLNPASPAAVPLREASGLKATAAAAMADEEETTESDEADATAASEVEDDDDDETQSEEEDASEESEEEDNAKKERSKKEKKKPSVFGSGMAYGNILLMRKFDEDTGFLFVLGNQRSLPRRSYYLDKKTKFYKVEDRERTNITRAELVDGERVVVSYIFQDRTYLADEVFMVIGDFHPPDYLPRSKKKRRKRS